MQFYGMNEQEVMELPLKLFWYLSGCINQLRAEQDMRNLSTFASAQGGKQAFQSKWSSLSKELGEVAKINPLAAKRDEEGFGELKRMSGNKKKG